MRGRLRIHGHAADRVEDLAGGRGLAMARVRSVGVVVIGVGRGVRHGRRTPQRVVI
ncbi:hypothetical protein BDIM_13630 [Brevundimonas diminuta ATCC 11568]|nr:hypothetical protein BDIM_13630 [Brevundimonas diminuta ATCC 11568]